MVTMNDPIDNNKPERQPEVQKDAGNVGASDVNNKKQTDAASSSNQGRNDDFSVHVKSEFVLPERATSLPVLRDSHLQEQGEANSNQQDTRSNSKNERGRKGKRDKKKKRPRDDPITAADKVCMAILRGDKCPFGDGCRFSHDLKAFLASRPPDISQVEGGCPNYHLTGSCQFGAMCRVGGSHLNIATGENLTMNPLPENPPKPVLNVMDKDTIILLRRKKYPFKTQRNDALSKQRQKAAEEESKDATKTSAASGKDETVVEASTIPTEAAPSMSPLPEKRKLIDFSNKVYVAPLTTVGNLPFRRIMKHYGTDITCGEMALSVNLIQGQPSEWALLKRHPDEDIFGVQIAAGYPDQFGRAAEVIADSNLQVDFVDLNLGCPLDLVCDKGAGAALMRREKQLRGTLASLVDILPCPVTVKMRTGWEMSKPFAHELVPKIQKWNIEGIGAIMVHGRSRLQRYSKEADWEYVQRVAQQQVDDFPKIPVIGNGDIFSYRDYETKVLSKPELTPCAMLGRGVLIKPWLPTEIKEKRDWDISASERLDMLKSFVKFGLEHWGSDQQGVNTCRRFLLEWLSFLHRYVPVGLLEVVPQKMNHRVPPHICGRSDLETLMLSPQSSDWIHISEMLLGPVPDGFKFEPKHQAKSYSTN